MSAIRIQGETLSALTAHLRSAAPEETGTFALLGSVRAASEDADLLVRGLILPGPDDWEAKGQDWLTPTTAFVNRAAVAADRLGLGLAFIHSHPGLGHPARLSSIDEVSTRKLFANLGSILGQVPLASLVFTPDSFAGVVSPGLPRSVPRRVGRLKVIGSRITTYMASDSPTSLQRDLPIGGHDRQVLALGEAGQGILARLTVGIIGAGGTGSAVAEQLARMGVRKLILVDDDRLVPSNVSRVYGSTPNQGRRKKPKVDVLSRHLQRIAPGIQVDSHVRSIIDPEMRSTLIDADVIFGCTDTDGSRATLNDLAYRYFVPVIDLGCRIDVTGGVVRGMYGRVRYLRPGLPCLWCTGTIDGTKILQESMSPSERKRLAASGYGSGLGPQPSVIHLTTLVSSLGVAELLSIAMGVGPEHDGTWLSVSLTDPFLRRVQSTGDPACRCQTLRGLGANGRLGT